MRTQIDTNTTGLFNLVKEVSLKTGDATLAKYFERIASTFHKDIGESKHSFKLNDTEFIEGNFKTEDAYKLKGGVESMVNKVEIVSRAIVNMRKFKTTTNEKLASMEEQVNQCVSKPSFADEMKQTELRIMNFLKEQTEMMQKQLVKHSQEVTDAKVQFGQKVDNFHSQVLWRIQHCEEMMKECCTEQRVIDLNDMHQNSVETTLKANDKRLQELIKDLHEKTNLRAKQQETYTLDKVTEAIAYMHEVETKFH
jgi:hypothetical protein